MFKPAFYIDRERRSLEVQEALAVYKKPLVNNEKFRRVPSNKNLLVAPLTDRNMGPHNKP